MAIAIDPRVLELLNQNRVARLATVDAHGQPMVVPICFAFDGSRIYSPVDEKPKSVEPEQLKRLRNIEANPRVSLVIDNYSEDWSQLAYAIVSGVAAVVSPFADPQEHADAVELLRKKYVQYRSMEIDRRLMIRITPTRIKSWEGT